MGARDIIGHIDCPVCGHEMPVKADKNGHAYGHCAHRCNAQVFTRNDHRDGLLRQRMRAVTVTGTDDNEPAPPPAPVREPAEPVPEPEKQSAPPAQKPKANWFNPIMGRSANGRA